MQSKNSTGFHVEIEKELYNNLNEFCKKLNITKRQITEYLFNEFFNDKDSQIKFIDKIL